MDSDSRLDQLKVTKTEEGLTIDEKVFWVSNDHHQQDGQDPQLKKV
jgi:hypothetical protein